MLGLYYAFEIFTVPETILDPKPSHVTRPTENPLWRPEYSPRMPTMMTPNPLVFSLRPYRFRILLHKREIRPQCACCTTKPSLPELPEHGGKDALHSCVLGGAKKATVRRTRICCESLLGLLYSFQHAFRELTDCH